MIIAVSFYGVCVKHNFAYIENIEDSIIVLKELVENGHNLVLFEKTTPLSDALNWFKENNIPLSRISKEPYFDILIDSKAVGCPLKCDYIDNEIIGKPYVDWNAIKHMLMCTGVLPYYNLICPNCNSSDIKTKNIYYDENNICNQEYECLKCKTLF